MRISKKLLTVLAAGMFTAMAASTALADTRLDDVTLTFSLGARNDYTYPELTVTPGETLYTVVSAAYVDYINPYTDKPNRNPTAEVVLEARDGFLFRTSAKSYFELDGAEVAYVDAVKSRDSKTMTLTVEFEDMGSDSIAAPQNLTFSPDGLVTWSPVGDALYYEVSLMRNNRTDLSATANVYGTSVSMASKMTQTGDYKVRVTAVSRYDKRVESEKAESAVITVDDNALASLTAAAASYAETPGQWMETAGQVWYRYADGSWPAAGWAQIDGAWYFFNPQGYRLTGWIMWKNQDYYCGSDGKMLTDTVTPDGYYVDGNGVWQENVTVDTVQTETTAAPEETAASETAPQETSAASTGSSGVTITPAA